MTTKILTVELRAQDAVNGIINLNNAIDKNTQQMKANSAQIKQNNEDIKNRTGDVMRLTAQNQQLAKANVELASKTKILKDERRVLQKETQNEIKMQVQEEGSLKALRAELSRATQEFDKLSRKERETGEQGKFLQQKINLLTTEIKDAEFATQRYYRNVGNYQNAIMNALGMNGRFGQSIMAITGMQSGFTSSLSSMASSVKAFGASLMALLTNPVFLAIAGIAGVGMAFKWFYDYNEGLAEATRLTREFTGYVGDDLLAMRNSIQATAEVMDKEFVDVLKTADSLMQNFKIDGETAMNIINQGFAAGGDLNGDMLDKIQRLAPAFKNAGMSAEQLVALITQTRSGIFTDQGLDAIAMGTSRIRQFSDNMKKALQGIGIDAEEMGRKLRTGEMSPFAALTEISAKLKELSPNTQEYGEVINAVFGKAGKTLSTEVVQGLADMSTSLDEAQAKTGQYGELLLENIKTEEDLNNATSALFDLTNKGWEEIKQQAIIYAKKALVAVVKALVDVTNWFINLYNKSLPVRVVVNSIAAQFRVMWASAKQAFRLIVDGFKAIGRAINAIVNMFSQAGNAISAFGRGVYDIFAGIANRSLSQIEKGWNTLKNGIGSAIKSSWDGIMSAISASWEETGADFGKYAKELGDIAGDAFANTLNGHLKTITIPNFSGGGGGGGSNNNLLDLKDNTNNNGGSKGGKGGKGNKGGGSRGGGSSSNNANDEAKKERDRIEKLANDLLAEAQKIEQKALQELAKTDEKAINQLFEQRKADVKKKYADLFSSGLLNATQKEDLKKAQKALLDDLEKQRLAAVIDLQTKEKNLLLQNQIAATNDAKKRHELELQQLDNQKEAELKKVGANEELKNAIIANFAQKRQDMVDKFAKEQLDATQKLLQTQMEGQAQDEEGRLARHKQNLELLRLQQQEELAQYENNEAMQLAIKDKYKQQELQLEQEYANKEREIQYQRYEAIAAVVGGLGQLMSEFQDENKSALAASKILALAEIMISQAVAIANAVKAGSKATNPWQMIAQIATSVTAVTVAMVQAFKSLNSAKFATGGYIQGAGTSTSDSIPVRVSNGESIMNANTTAMFGGLLSSLNQLGGGVPIQVQETASSVRGEDMLARAVARGVAMLPAPVVSVQDINDGQRQVEVMNERATL